jgi:hypothetical protein
MLGISIYSIRRSSISSLETLIININWLLFFTCLHSTALARLLDQSLFCDVPNLTNIIISTIHPLCSREYPAKRPEPLSRVPRRTRTVPTRILVDKLGPHLGVLYLFCRACERQRGSRPPFMINPCVAPLRRTIDATGTMLDFEYSSCWQSTEE